jgi:LmbE family N-acetylglucosaminyl deacetylase
MKSHAIRWRRYSVLPLFCIILEILASSISTAQADSTLRVLIVTAHPDDEVSFAVTVYKITHDLHGTVDLALITNGEAGYKYSTLAESYYGAELTDEKIGRQLLPTIRKKEIMAAGEIIGIRNYYFFDQQDNQYTLNVDSVFRYVWNLPLIKDRLQEIMVKGNYHYVFCLLPTEGTHGQHKGATIMALETVKSLPAAKRPIVLGVTDSNKTDTASLRFNGLKGYDVTSIRSGRPIFSFDRTQKFGFHDQLDYKIIANWVLAEYKSQGVTQLGMNQGDVENFWYFDINDPAAIPKTRELFERLKVNTFKKKEY